MSCDCTPFIYTVNPGGTADAGATIPAGSVVHQMCDRCVLNGDGIVCGRDGVYFADVDVNVSVPTATDGSPIDGKVEVVQDGKLVAGASVTSTMSSGTQVSSLHISTVIRSDPKKSTVLTVRNATPAQVSFTNCAIRVR